MLNSKKTVIVLFLFCMFLTSSAQDKLQRVMIVRSSPSVTLLVNFNYDQAMGQLAGTYNNDFHSDQFLYGRAIGTDKGIGGKIISKFAVNKNGHLRITASGSFNHLVSYLFGKEQLADIGESKINIYSGGIGVENSFTPNHDIKLYIGAEALFNMINGKATV